MIIRRRRKNGQLQIRVQSEIGIQEGGFEMQKYRNERIRPKLEKDEKQYWKKQ